MPVSKSTISFREWHDLSPLKVYENGVASRLLLINHVQPTTAGANDYVATFAVGGGDTGLAAVTPSSVKVKYLKADSVSSKENITW